MSTNTTPDVVLENWQPRSLVEWSKLEIRRQDILLGDGWLEIGGITIISAASGIGKSVAANQATALWSCGRSAFGISPPRPLKIFMVQGEDGHNDSVSMAQVVDHLGLSEDTRALVDQNSVVGQHEACSASEFIAFLEAALEATPSSRRPDIVIINPMNNFAGDDRDPVANKMFASGLKRLMEKYRFGTVIVHHTPKTNYQSSDNYKPEDWQYADAGGWIITANARAKILIKSTKEQGTYRFIASKRGNRLNWTRGESGLPERYFKHCTKPGVLMWEDAEPPTKQSAEPKQKLPDLDAVLEMIPMRVPKGKDAVTYDVQTRFEIGRDAAKNLLNALRDRGDIHTWILEKVDKTKKGKPPEGWCRRPQEMTQVELAVDGLN